jgi:hypothetical protein
MKPRICMRHGVWVCGLFRAWVFVPPLGHGYTPSQAYADWVEQL